MVKRPQPGLVRDRVLRRAPDALTRTIAGETLLIPVKGRLADLQRIFALDPSAAFIWERLDGKRELGAILGALTEEFDVAAEEAAADLTAFIQELEAAGLLAEVS